ncbi:FepA family TonB-dependent siderophore receptor [Lonepinella koalarum]|uniref:Ferric enterobactin receptor n=1 Tax=Lonepinella koalarum TaxID=53417 RepID=A0A4R1KT80_9PAST|nr:FepA family TonB-dependent siderophore receptor [Lonepinella koalarum]MDH2927503.1 outer membrane receptor protein [Lonepinella koalarum]TCK68355.1 ferric enterobactin receptor [Lonepinella koalarum]TFJ89611.1 TonB-dependent receptor [Lonepinella koalarum]
MKGKHTLYHPLSLISLSILSTFAMAQTAQNVEQLDTIYITAEQQLQQSLGVSHISQKNIEKRPPANDISELVRTMPGVNLTGNSATGQRGNKRQIDIRGMGPENTLILIDGKPVTSRNAERMGWRGERNTRGDSNWVPVEEIESITVLRGPAAARYGSGAMGGVVNIKTKPASNEYHGEINYYMNHPEDSKEGGTQRVGFNLSGPIITDVLAFRLYGSANKTEADAVDINPNSSFAGVEGVRNRDIAGRLTWTINPRQSLSLDASFSRQGNIYNGDSQNSNVREGNTTFERSLDLRNSNAETARLYRSAFSLTHKGDWDWGGLETIISYDRTKNSRLQEGLYGGPEGIYTNVEETNALNDPNDGAFKDSDYKNFRFSSEADIPFTAGVAQVLTLGVEYNHYSLDDPSSMRMQLFDQNQQDYFPTLANFQSQGRSGKHTQNAFAVYAENNIYVTEKTTIIPAIRFDHNSDSGNNWSPSLNFAHSFNEMFTMRGGIARAYKAPNLYQSHPNYLLYTRGQGCPIHLPNGVRCYLLGNPDLKPETSVNKEIGLEFAHNGWQASVNYFHNAYRNKIIAGDDVIDSYVGSRFTSYLLRWDNVDKATIAGIEGNLVIPILENLQWSNNFTYMHKSKDHLGNPLSITPKHTINTTLAYQATDKLDVNVTFTHYGRQHKRTVATNRTEDGRGGNGTVAYNMGEDVASYGIWGINAGYQFTKQISARIGINNLFNKKLYRTEGQVSLGGANTYNEHGRAYFASVKIGF